MIVTSAQQTSPRTVTVAQLQKVFRRPPGRVPERNVKGIFRFGDTVSADINVVLPRKLLEDAKSFTADNNRDNIFVLIHWSQPGN